MNYILKKKLNKYNKSDKHENLEVEISVSDFSETVIDSELEVY